MKRLLALGLTTLLALPVLSVAIVSAEAASTPSSVATTITTTTKTDTTTTAPSATDTAASLAARVATRKAALKTKLTSVQKLRVQTKCVAAQVLVGGLRDRAKTVATTRSSVYGEITVQLDSLSAKLKNKNIDTTALNADITTLKGKVVTFNTDLTTYQQTVSDVAAIDCKTDPEGFQASLDTTRTAQLAVSQDALAIRTYITDTIKPLLVTIRTQLTPKTSASSTTGGGQ